MAYRVLGLLLCLLSLPDMAQAWWNADWQYRKKITVDTTASGSPIEQSLSNVPVLVRLHSGNFAYFLDVQPNAEDIRFIASDDTTPLDFQIERFDVINQMALIWVNIPQLQANRPDQSIWMYYGNAQAVSSSNPQATFDDNYTGVYHFNNGEGTVGDSTAYQHHAIESTAEINPACLIGTGLNFDGEAYVVLPQTPALAIDSTKGFSFSAWIRFDETQTQGTLYERRGENTRIGLKVNGSSLVGFHGADEKSMVQTAPIELLPQSWQHVAFTAENNTLHLYVNGKPRETLELPELAFTGKTYIGAGPKRRNGFVGQMDELRVSDVARDAKWFGVSVKSQSPIAQLLAVGEDEQYASTGSSTYMMTIIESIDETGWSIIVLLVMMGTVSMMVIVAKGIVLHKVQLDNSRFIQDFRRVRITSLGSLDGGEDEDEAGLGGSELMTALFGKHDHYQSSSLYRLYHAGIDEMNSHGDLELINYGHHTLGPNALSAIRAAMNTELVRQLQKLNSKLVVVTVAISGGPFLGLMGTVIGVMVTFAVIATTGDVNVNTIAPGVAAALMTTVAGLCVAIPSLFGYNYLAIRLRDITADMRAFIEQFASKVARDPSTGRASDIEPSRIDKQTQTGTANLVS